MNLLRCLAAAGLCATLTACFRANTITTRHFLLTPALSTATTKSDVRLGVGIVKMPEYLLKNSLAVRKNAGEISYLETAVWAERLDKGFARVLAANLSAMIPTDEVRLGSWRAKDVMVEVYVNVQQFDVDQSGKGTLTAWWRITAPGGAEILKSGETRLTKTGQTPASNAENVVTTLSQLTADFSGTLAQAVREVAPR